MSQDKELLLKDLCARLPHNVKIHAKYTNLGETIEVDGIVKMIDGDGAVGIEVIYDTSSVWTYIQIDNVKPYLFPFSSMTEEQKKYISDRWGINEDFDFEIDPNWGEYFVDLCDAVDYINWLNENHFDFRGLIEKGIANDATGLNIY